MTNPCFVAKAQAYQAGHLSLAQYLQIVCKSYLCCRFHPDQPDHQAVMIWWAIRKSIMVGLFLIMSGNVSALIYGVANSAYFVGRSGDSHTKPRFKIKTSTASTTGDSPLRSSTKKRHSVQIVSFINCCTSFIVLDISKYCEAWCEYNSMWRIRCKETKQNRKSSFSDDHKNYTCISKTIG